MSSTPKLILTFTAIALGSWGLGHLGQRFRTPVVVVPKSAATTVKTAKDRLTTQAFLTTQALPKLTARLQDRSNFLQKLESTTEEAALWDIRKDVDRLTDLSEKNAREMLLAYRLVELKFAGRLIQDQFAKNLPFATTLMQAWSRLSPDTFRVWLTAFMEKNNSLAVAGSTILKDEMGKNLTLDAVEELMKSNKIRGASELTAAYDAAKREAMENPQATLDKVLTFSEPARYHAMAGLGAGWAKRDATAALAWAKELSEPRERINVLTSICREQLKQDLEAAKRTLDLIPPARDVIGGDVQAEFAAKLAERDPVAAAAHIKKLEATFPREEMLATCVLPHLKDLSLKSLDQVFSGMPVQGRSHDLANTTDLRIGLLSTLVQWNPPNPQALLQEASTMAPGEIKTCMQNYLAWRVAQDDPSKAVDLAAAATGVEKERLLNHALNFAAGTGKMDLPLIQRALEMADPASKSFLIDKQIAILARDHPDQTKEYLAVLPESERHIAAARAGAQLALYDPQAALNLADSLPADRKAPHLYSVGYVWAQEDPAAASRWANGLPPGTPEQQQAVASLSEGLVKTVPNQAFQWAQKLTDRNNQLNHFHSTYFEWIDRDSHAALKAITSAGLQPEELQRVLTPPPSWIETRKQTIKVAGQPNQPNQVTEIK